MLKWIFCFRVSLTQFDDDFPLIITERVKKLNAFVFSAECVLSWREACASDAECRQFKLADGLFFCFVQQTQS